MLVGKVELVKERDGAEFLLKPLGFFLFLLLVVNWDKNRGSRNKLGRKD